MEKSPAGTAGLFSFADRDPAGIAACWAIVDSYSRLLAVGAASVTGTTTFLAAAVIHPERNRATPITPVEIGGATQVWDSSPRYAQFRAPAFPSPVPCRSRCRALASLARARTSDDIRPRALCTPPPKSFARTPDLCTQPILPRATKCDQHRFAPGVHFGANSQHTALTSAHGPCVRVR